MSQKLKVSIAKIKKILLNDLGVVAQDVEQSLYVLNLTTFKGTKPVLQSLLLSTIATYFSLRTAYKLGGLSDKKPFEDAYDALILLLIALAPYVDDIADGDEDTLKLSRLPYTTGVNETGLRIVGGELAQGLTYKVGTTGKAMVSCAYFGPETKYICIASQGKPLPLGTKMNHDGQMFFPDGETVPSHIININGSRDKTLYGMIPKVDYYLTYIVMCGGFVSDMSVALIIVCGN